MTYAYDPQLAPMLAFLPELTIADVTASRVGFEQMISQLNADLDDSGVAIDDRLIPGAPEVPVRIYSPQALAGPVPGLLYIHGGGFVIGSLDSEHGSCLAIGNAD